MLVNGPSEWSEALLTTGVKSDLLRNGYNERLNVAAMLLGTSVVLIRYAETNNTTGYARSVLDQACDRLELHEATSDHQHPSTRYGLTAWAGGSGNRSLLAVASSTQVEVWEVVVASEIKATLKGCKAVRNPRGLAWNPVINALLIYSNDSIELVDASKNTLSSHAVCKSNLPNRAWVSCSWSPCGLRVSVAQNHIFHCFSWSSVDALLTDSPNHDQLDVGSFSKTSDTMLDADGSIGPIAAVRHISAAVCIATTDTNLVLEDVASIRTKQKTSQGQTLSTLPEPSSLLIAERRQRPLIEEVTAEKSSEVIDLTSMRVTANSSSNPLQILRHRDHSLQARSRRTAHSHLLLLECKASRWDVTRFLQLPHLTSPDLLIVQEMRAIVGSTLSPRLVVAHLDVSSEMEWSVSLLGEMELPSTHVCRGLHLPERSPFVDVASTEKRKRATFFHAAASNDPQTIYLSKFKVPRRARPSVSSKGAAAQHDDDKTLGSSSTGGNKNSSPLELILATVTALQKQMNARFDAVDDKLQQLTSRIEQLERSRGKSS